MSAYFYHHPSPSGSTEARDSVEGTGVGSRPATQRFWGKPHPNPSPEGEGLKRARRIAIFGAALLGLAAALTAPAMAQGDIQSRLAAYKQRVTLLEDQDAIENLQATYGYYFDKGLWDQAAALFSAKGSFEYGMRGVYITPARIQRAMLLFGPQGLAKGYLNTHMMLQPYVVVAKDGKTATARWQGMMQLAQPQANGIWGVGITNADYVKEAGVWKIAKLHFYVTAQGDYDGGFMKAALPLDGPSALFPPDASPTEVYRPFPAAYIPPFNFDHPVTGKSLRNLPQPADNVVRK